MTQKFQSSGRWRILLLVGLFVASVVLVSRHLSTLSTRLVETSARENAEHYSEALRVVRSRYTSEVVERVRQHGVEITHDYLDKQGAIPLPATLTFDLGQQIGKSGSGVRVSLYSDAPFPWRGDRQMDAFQKLAWERLKQQPSEPVEQFDWTRRVLRYATADVMRASCVECHNTHPDTPRSDWIQGDVRGVLEVTLPLEHVVAETQAGLRGTFMLMAGLGGLGLLALGFVVAGFRRDSRELQRRGDQTTEALRLQQQSNDELDQRSAELVRANDEMALRSDALEEANRRLESQAAVSARANRQLESQTAALTRVQQTIRTTIARLETTTSEILSTTRQQAVGAQEQAARVSELATAVDELAESAQQANVRARQVADFSRQMDDVGREGRAAVENSTAAMADAKSQVETIAQHILQSAERTRTIGLITATVRDVADQTNVLALNAAIESARAGEHGKGFSVVAGEVRSLAEQSKKATAQVRTILGDIQKASEDTVTATEKGTHSVTTTAAVLDKAGSTIEQLTDTIAAAASAARQISAAVSQQATSTAKLREGMNSINKIARDNLVAVHQIERAAQELSALTGELATLTGANGEPDRG